MSSAYENIKQKIIVITGGTQGLGEGIARYLAEQSVAGLLITGRNAEKGQAVAQALQDAGTDCHFVQADLSQPEDCRAIIQTADQHFGRVDGLVNAAGDTSRGTIEDTSVELWDQIFAVNTRAPFILMQEAAKLMKREGRGGSIVNILSISGHGGQPFLTAYCTSKGALATLTKNVAHALMADKIRVNGLNIGWMATPNEHKVQLSMGQPEDWLAQADAERPFGRILRPRDVAKLTTYLLSDDAALMTGTLIDFEQRVIGAFD